jgi:hypothetical protein
MQPASFTYRILLTPDYVNSLPKDAADLALLKSGTAGQATPEPAKAAQ